MVYVAEVSLLSYAEPPSCIFPSRPHPLHPTAVASSAPIIVHEMVKSKPNDNRSFILQLQCIPATCTNISTAVGLVLVQLVPKQRNEYRAQTYVFHDVSFTCGGRRAFSNNIEGTSTSEKCPTAIVHGPSPSLLTHLLGPFLYTFLPGYTLFHSCPQSHRFLPAPIWEEAPAEARTQSALVEA